MTKHHNQESLHLREAPLTPQELALFRQITAWLYDPSDLPTGLRAKSCWFEDNPLGHFYMRKRVKPGGHLVLTFSNISVAQTSRGTLTRLLNAFELLTVDLIFENVLEERLARYLQRRGYSRSSDYPPTLRRTLPL